MLLGKGLALPTPSQHSAIPAGTEAVTWPVLGQHSMPNDHPQLGGSGGGETLEGPPQYAHVSLILTLPVLSRGEGSPSSSCWQGFAQRGSGYYSLTLDKALLRALQAKVHADICPASNYGSNGSCGLRGFPGNYW